MRSARRESGLKYGLSPDCAKAWMRGPVRNSEPRLLGGVRRIRNGKDIKGSEAREVGGDFGAVVHLLAIPGQEVLWRQHCSARALYLPFLRTADTGGNARVR